MAVCEGVVEGVVDSAGDVVPVLGPVVSVGTDVGTDVGPVEGPVVSADESDGTPSAGLPPAAAGPVPVTWLRVVPPVPPEMGAPVASS